ncbi:hypothetical protein [Faecalibacter sp. LW9]|uniref:hypothetical protein n=1 Tax=Faecalibacter sp. LW9 TaxID=3103144 RepID=UPI002AFFF898|nr:hypothetical protein [Faecalibacter sp. LW9]
MPIIIQPYHIKNIKGDDLNNLNLQIPSDKYIVAISNFEAIDNAGQGFKSENGKRGKFQYEIFDEGGIWRVRIENPSVNPLNVSNTFDYKFGIIIYSKRFFNDLGEIEFLNVGRNGNAGDVTIVN